MTVVPVVTGVAVMAMIVETCGGVSVVLGGSGVM